MIARGIKIKTNSGPIYKRICAEKNTNQPEQMRRTAFGPFPSSWGLKICGGPQKSSLVAIITVANYWFLSKHVIRFVFLPGFKSNKLITEFCPFSLANLHRIVFVLNYLVAFEWFWISLLIKCTLLYSNTTFMSYVICIDSFWLC